MQFFLQSNLLKKSLHTIKPLYPECLASHRGAQCVGPRLLTNPALPRARRLASLLMRPLIHRQIEVIGIGGTTVPLRETLVLGMARLGHSIEELLEAGNAAVGGFDRAYRIAPGSRSADLGKRLLTG